MLWLLLSPILFGLALRHVIVSGGLRRGDWFDKGSRLCGCFLAAALGFFVACGIAALIGLLFETYPTQTSDVALAAIRTKDATHGEFYFLGAGYIGEEQYYFYYTKDPDGAYHPGKEAAGPWVSIYEETTASPHLVTYTWKLKYPWAKWIAFTSDGDGHAYEFHVPQGTIVRGFSM